MYSLLLCVDVRHSLSVPELLAVLMGDTKFNNKLFSASRNINTQNTEVISSMFMSLIQNEIVFKFIATRFVILSKQH